MSAPGAAAPLHASCVAVAGRAVLITGAAGSGKSALACRMLALGADLVADDRVLLRPGEHGPMASPPAQLAGLLECRGLGILRLVHAAPAQVVLVADLDAAESVRLPQLRKTCLTDTWLPLIAGQMRPNLAHELTVILRLGRTPFLLDPEDPQDAVLR